MKRIVSVLLLLSLLCFGGCAPAQEDPDFKDEPVWLNMNLEYPAPTTLEDGNGERVRVIFLLGQSNATGCSLTSYLRESVDEARYERYSQGFSSVQINFCIDDHRYTSNGEFVDVDLNCGAGEGCFGPELGIAEMLSELYPNERIFLLKYTMSGYSLHHHWLSEGKRGSIYEAFLGFANTYLKALSDHNYQPEVGAICWMQGESDTTEFKASRYYENQTSFVSYLREDLAEYAAEGGIYFIDAGISDSPYCLPSYPEINEAKVKFSKDSPLNFYFSTIDAGLTVHMEPAGDPDWGHYDAVSELTLGRTFGLLIAQSYGSRNQ